jgi:hypothetical protein
LDEHGKELKAEANYQTNCPTNSPIPRNHSVPYSWKLEVFLVATACPSRDPNLKSLLVGHK